MLHRTEAVVLKSTPYGEADLIVTHFTPDLGIVKLFAKSPRKIRSRFGSSLEPLTHSRIAFWGKEEAKLPKLTQSDIIHPFQKIRNSLNSFLCIAEIIELILHFIPERDENRAVYTLLINTLHEIENHGNETILINQFKVKLIRFVGFAPKLDVCGRCGKTGDSFYVSDGTVLCNLCKTGSESSIKISLAVLKLYENLLTWETDKIHRIKPSQAVLTDLTHIITTHIRYILARPLKCSKLTYTQ